MKKLKDMAIVPLMPGFSAMGFAGLARTASNDVKACLPLSDTRAKIPPSPVLSRFSIFSVPTGKLMNTLHKIHAYAV